MITKIFCDISELDQIKKFNNKKIVKVSLVDSKKFNFKINDGEI
jgi:hypothetical protein